MKQAKRSVEAFAGMEELEARALMAWTFFGPESATGTPLPSDSAENSVFADFDGDGLADRATSSWSTVSFAKGLGDGTFGADVVTNVGAPVGRLTAGRFDGTALPSLIAVGTRGGSVDYNRPNPGFRLRSIAFDAAANGGTGGFVVMAALDVADYYRLAALPEAVAGDLVSGWREEFVINLAQGNGQTNIVMFALKNRTTIQQKGSVLASSLKTEQVLIGDLNASGKGEVICTQVGLAGAGTDSIVRLTTGNEGATWNASTVRTFPVTSMSLGLGDLDSDGHTDIAALAVRSNGEARVWKIRSTGVGFETPRAYTRVFGQSEWTRSSYSESLRIGGIVDLNGDGRRDVLLSFTDVRIQRQNEFTLRVVVATQRSDGTGNLIEVPKGLSYSSTYVPRTWGVLVGPVINGAPTLVVNKTGLLLADVAHQRPEILSGYAYVPGYMSGHSSVGLPATFSVEAWDADLIRGGTIARVEYVIDLDENDQVGGADIVVGNAMTLDGAGRYTLIANVDASWHSGPGIVRVLARAFDGSGNVSSVWTYEMTV